MILCTLSLLVCLTDNLGVYLSIDPRIQLIYLPSTNDLFKTPQKKKKTSYECHVKVIEPCGMSKIGSEEDSEGWISFRLSSLIKASGFLAADYGHHFGREFQSRESADPMRTGERITLVVSCFKAQFPVFSVVFFILFSHSRSVFLFLLLSLSLSVCLYVYAIQIYKYTNLCICLLTKKKKKKKLLFRPEI